MEILEPFRRVQKSMGKGNRFVTDKRGKNRRGFCTESMWKKEFFWTVQRLLRILLLAPCRGRGAARTLSDGNLYNRKVYIEALL